MKWWLGIGTRCIAIRFRLCWRHSDDLFVCFSAKPTQKTEGEICHETGSGGGKEGPREDREDSWQSRTEENSRLEIAVQRMRLSAEGGSEKMDIGQRRESTEVRKATAKTCWPTEAGLTNARRCQLVCGLEEVSCKIHANNSLQMYSVRQTPRFLRLELTQVRVCSFVLFFHPLCGA